MAKVRIVVVQFLVLWAAYLAATAALALIGVLIVGPAFYFIQYGVARFPDLAMIIKTAKLIITCSLGLTAVMLAWGAFQSPPNEP